MVGFYKHLNQKFHFEVLLCMKSSIFWDTTPNSPLKVNRSFGGTCGLHLQGRRISQERDENCAYYPLHAAFFLSLFIDPEYGSDMFL
jgi:hypothetical protein